MDQAPKQTTERNETELIEMPPHMALQLAETARIAQELTDSKGSLSVNEGAIEAQQINDTRPEGMPPTLPDVTKQSEYNELTASTVRSHR